MTAVRRKRSFDTSKPKIINEEALLKLYEHLKARSPATSFASLSAEDRRVYMRDAKRRSRGRLAEAAAAGAIAATRANIREALADAALMILATEAPGAAQVRAVLESIFAARPGTPISVELRARAGKLRPRLLSRIC